MSKAARWLSTLLLSPFLLLVELKLVAKVGNRIPLASTDKTCELLKWNSKKTMFPLRAGASSCLHKGAILSQVPRGSVTLWKRAPRRWQGHASDALSTHWHVYCGLLCFREAYQRFLQGAVQIGSAASELPKASAGSTSSFHPVTFLIGKSGCRTGPFCSVFMQPNATTTKHGHGNDNYNYLQFIQREAESHRCIRS